MVPHAVPDWVSSGLSNGLKDLADYQVYVTGSQIMEGNAVNLICLVKLIGQSMV